MIKPEEIKSMLMLAAVGAAGYLAYKAYKGGAGVAETVTKTVETVKQAATQAAADVTSAWDNNIAGPFAQGSAWENGDAPSLATVAPMSRAALYSDYVYTGIDPHTGRLVTDGEWYGNDEARRYDAKQRAIGGQPAATSIDGAAFGIYPRVKSGIWGVSTAAAAEARKNFAAGDVRRVDLKW